MKEFRFLPARVRQRVVSFLLRWGHCEEALPAARVLAEEHPEGILHRLWLGQCLLGIGRTAEAEALIAAVHAGHPESPLARAALVDLLLAEGRLKPAFDACQELFRPPQGERVAAWEKLAGYHLRAGQPAQALACCRRCEALRRERAAEGRGDGEAPGPFLRLLAQVYAANGDEEAAAATRRASVEREAREAALLREECGGALECGSVGVWECGGGEGTGADETGRQGDRETGRPDAWQAPISSISSISSLSSVSSRAEDEPGASSPPLPVSGPAPRPPSPVPPPPPHSVGADLKTVFGHTGYLPGQREVIGRVMAGEDVMAILPTGGGKSLCYQLPALRLPHAVVVISPLIALMRDQVESVPPALAPRVTVINSTVESAQIRERLRGIASGRFRLVYAAPERLRQWPFVHALRQAGVSLFVVDEAHCISLWGHDFRPDYFFIGPALRQLGEPPVLALTATAAPDVRREIGERLGRAFSLVNAGIARPNLRLEVYECPDEEAKLALLVSQARAAEGSGIVYARARDRCEELARVLRGHGVSAIHYHARMETEERSAAQAAFMGGERRVVCATVAFGMGIDKADVRWITHYNLPKSVENYWQEAGRAGRDGLPAKCVLLATPADQAQLVRWLRKEAVQADFVWQLCRAARDLLGGPGPGRVVFDDLARAVGEEETGIRVALGLLERLGLIVRYPDLPRTLSLRPIRRVEAPFAAFLEQARLRLHQELAIDSLELCERTGIHPAELESRLLAWRDAGWLELRSSGRDALLSIPEPPPGADEQLGKLLRLHQERQEERVCRMVAYAGSSQCRHAFIAGVFGEPAPTECRSCDACLPPVPPPIPPERRQAPSAPPASPELAVLQTLATCRIAVGRRGLVNILRGSVAAPPSAGHCPTFGTLRSWSRGEAGRLIDRLVQRGCLRVEQPDEYPLLCLTDRGRQALAAGALPDGTRAKPGSAARILGDERDAHAPAAPDAGRAGQASAPPAGGPGVQAPATAAADSEVQAPASPSAGGPSADDLFERLKAWRRVVAAEQGHRAFVIFHDTALRAIAAARPRNMADLAATRGVGPAKIERYGEAILQLVREHDG